jgi:hypothetical protein
MKHRHSEIIKAFVNGKECEYYIPYADEWEEINFLSDFDNADKVRVKPEPKEDIEETVLASYGVDGLVIFNRAIPRNLKVIFDGETGKLKSAEVLK